MKQQNNRNSSRAQNVAQKTPEGTRTEKVLLDRTNRINSPNKYKRTKTNSNNSTTRVPQEITPYHQPIKYDKLYYDILEWDDGSDSDDDFDDDKSTKSSKSSGSVISFNNNVSVVPIPDRNHYDESVRARIWSGGNEISANAQRNAFEFHSEGWDWRNVAEDHEMIKCSESGELVHPVHYKKFRVTH